MERPKPVTRRSDYDANGKTLLTFHLEQVALSKHRREQVDHIKQRQASLEQEAAHLEQERTSLEQEIAYLELERARLEQKTARLEQERASLEQTSDSLERAPAHLELQHIDPSVMDSGPPRLLFNGLSPIDDASSPGGPPKVARQIELLRKLRAPPFKYAWNFYHDKHSSSGNYEGRLTLMKDEIITAKPFWEVLNSFPLERLQLKDSVHFFKRGVKPVWEDPRNVKGGSWTFRVPKAQAEQFWKEVLMMAVGEQFADVIQPGSDPGDDLCGLSMSVRFNNNLISIWNRDGTNSKTKDGILAVVQENISPELKPREGHFYYKPHCDHVGFSEVVAKANATKADAGKITEAEVMSTEGDRALLRDEGMSVEELERTSA